MPLSNTIPATPLELYRRALGLSRSDLAAMAQVHRETIARIERRAVVPHDATAAMLAQVLGVPADALFPPAEVDEA